jgi:hypothetical protein
MKGQARPAGASDPQLYLHIGPPRTATTTLQRYFFPTLENHIVLQKQAFQFTGDSAKEKTYIQYDHKNESIRGFSASGVERRLAILEHSPHGIDSEARDELHTMLKIVTQLACLNQSVHDTKLLRAIIKRVIFASTNHKSTSDNKRLIIAGEWLSNSPAALSPLDKPMQRTLPSQIIVDIWRELSGTFPIMGFCLRSPVDLLCSRYFRFLGNTHPLTIKQLRSPGSWTLSQCQLFKRSPFHSALFPAFHKTFLKYHAKLGNIRPYGFAALQKTSDIAKLLGIPFEPCISFRELPKENAMGGKIAALKEEVAQQVISILRREGLYDRMHNEQMYE